MNEFNLVPKLRFSEFKDSWQTKILNDLGSVVNGLTYSPNDIDDNGVLVLRSSNIQNNRLSFLDKVHVQIDDYNEVLEDDILICVRNGSKRLIGKNVIIPKDIEGVAFGAFMSVYRSDFNKFVYQLFATQSYQKTIYKNLGATINSINNSEIKKFQFNFPSLPEQQKIASFLTDVDDKITQLTKKKSLLEQYKKGIMQKIFNQELRFKDDEGNSFPDWEGKKLSLVGKIITGKTPSTSNKKLWGGDIQFVTPTDINEDEKYQKSTNRTVNFNEKLKVLPKHSIIYTCIASIGKMALSVHPCITNQQINSLVPNKGFNNEYIYYVLLQITPKIKSTQANTTLPIINKTEFSKFKIPVPCLEEQTKIANFLSDIDVKIEALNIKIENSKTFKKGLLQKMFV